MSKSLGNVVLVHDLVKQYPGEVIRWALLSGHYRSPLDWTPELLEQSRKNLDYFYGVLRRAKHVEVDRRVLTQDPTYNLTWLMDDLNTPGQMADLRAAAECLDGTVSGRLANHSPPEHYKSALFEMARMLGLFTHWENPDAWFEGGASDDLKAKVEALIAERIAARAAKDFAAADRIRDQLTALNVVVMDGPTGATWRMKD
jgi:cysteinyl-tRNA synthetase